MIISLGAIIVASVFVIVGIISLVSIIHISLRLCVLALIIISLLRMIETRHCC